MVQICSLLRNPLAAWLANQAKPRNFFSNPCNLVRSPDRRTSLAIDGRLARRALSSQVFSEFFHLYSGFRDGVYFRLQGWPTTWVTSLSCQIIWNIWWHDWKFAQNCSIWLNPCRLRLRLPSERAYFTYKNLCPNQWPQYYPRWDRKCQNEGQNEVWNSTLTLTLRQSQSLSLPDPPGRVNKVFFETQAFPSHSLVMSLIRVFIQESCDDPYQHVDV